MPHDLKRRDRELADAVMCGSLVYWLASYSIGPVGCRSAAVACLVPPEVEASLLGTRLRGSLGR